MLKQTIIDEVAGKVKRIMENSPAQDMERNIRATLQNMFSKLDLVSREEFEVQQQVLLRTREKLNELERRIAELENVDKHEPGSSV